MTISSGCSGRGFSSQHQWDTPSKQDEKGFKGNSRNAFSQSFGHCSGKGPTYSADTGDDYLYGGSSQNNDSSEHGQWGNSWNTSGQGRYANKHTSQKESGNTHQRGSSSAQSNANAVGSTQNAFSDSDSINDRFSSFEEENQQRSLEMQKQAEETARMLDKVMAQTIRDSCMAQSDKLIVDTNNAVLNGYVDSANKSNNANIQSGKGINF